MTVFACNGSIGSYTAPSESNPTALSQIQQAITAGQTSYNQAQQTFSSAQNTYNIKLAVLQAAILQMQTDRANNASQSTLDVDQSALSNALSDFQSAASTYESATNSYQSAACYLVNTNSALQQYTADGVTTTINGVVSANSSLTTSDPNVNNALAQLQSANSTAQTAQSTLQSDLATYNQAAATVNDDLITLLQLTDTSEVTQAEFLLGNATQQDVTNAQNAAATQQSQTNTDTTTRNNALNTVSGNISSYQTALSTITNILQTGYLDLSGDLATYVSQLNQAVTAADSTMQAALNAKISANNAALGALDTSITNDAPSLASSLASALGLSEISVPTITAGGSFSILQIMEIFGSVALLLQTESIQNRNSTSQIAGLRMSIWSDILAATSAFNAAYQVLLSQETAYNSQVVTTNNATYQTQVAATNNYNANLSTYNAAITQVNSNLNTEVSQTNQLISGYNQAAASSVTTINTTNANEPDAVNFLNLFGTDSPIIPPSPLPTPSTVPATSASQIPLLTTLPQPPDPTTATTVQINAYNTQVQQINETLANPAVLQALGVQQVTQIPLLYYEQQIPVNATYNTQTATASTSSLSNLVDSGATANNYSPALAIYRAGRLIQVPLQSPPQDAATVQHSGGNPGLSSTGTIEPSAVSGALTALLQQQTFYSLIQTFLNHAAIQAAINVAPGVATAGAATSTGGQFSTLGILNGELGDEDALSETHEINAAIQAANLQNTQLTAVAAELVNESQDEALLQHGAASLIASTTGAQNLTATDLQELQKKLVFIEKLTLLLYAAFAAASAGEHTSATQVATTLQSLTVPNAVLQTLLQAPQSTPVSTAQGTPTTTLQSTPVSTAQGTPTTTLQSTPTTTLQSAPISTAQGTPTTTLLSTPTTTLQSTPISTAQGIPITTLQGTPITALQGAPISTAQGTPTTTLQSTPITTLQGAPVSTAQGTPTTTLQSTPISTAQATPTTTLLSTPTTTLQGAPISTAQAIPTTTLQNTPLFTTQGTPVQPAPITIPTTPPTTAAPAPIPVSTSLPSAPTATIPPTPPTTPPPTFTSLLQLANTATPQNQTTIIPTLTSGLQSLGVPPATISRFHAATTAEEEPYLSGTSTTGAATSASAQGTTGETSAQTPVALALEFALSYLAEDLIANLGINLGALPPAALSSLTEQTANALPSSISSLPPQSSASLALAIGAGIITPSNAQVILAALIGLQTQGLNNNTIVRALNAFAANQHENAELDKIAGTKSAIVNNILDIRNAIHDLTITQVEREIVNTAITNFSQFIATQNDFYQFSINFLLDPAKSFVKNFSLLTAEPGSGGRQQTSNIIPV